MMHYASLNVRNSLLVVEEGDQYIERQYCTPPFLSIIIAAPGTQEREYNESTLIEMNNYLQQIFWHSRI